RRLAFATRLPKVDVSGKLAHDQDIQAGYDLGLERRRIGQLGIQNGRPQVSEQTQGLAQAQYGLFRPQLTRQAVVLPVSDGAKKNGRRLPGQIEDDGRQRMAVNIVSGAADGLRFEFKV